MKAMQQNITEETISNALQEVMDPEIPMLSIVDLGIVRKVELDGDRIAVEIMPTFVGCPALDVGGAVEVRPVMSMDL